MTIQRILLIVAVVVAVFTAFIGFDVVHSDYYGGWLALAVALGLASRL